MELESRSSNLIIGSNCIEPPTPDMTWIRIPTVNQQFMNVETLTCLGRRRNDGDNVTLSQCRNENAGWQKINCIKNQAGIKIGWKVKNQGERFLQLQDDNRYAISTTSESDQLWNNSKTYCTTSSSYKGIVNNLVLRVRYI